MARSESTCELMSAYVRRMTPIYHTGRGRQQQEKRGVGEKHEGESK